MNTNNNISKPKLVAPPLLLGVKSTMGGEIRPVLVLPDVMFATRLTAPLSWLSESLGPASATVSFMQLSPALSSLL
jgi:hypothetical protein